MNKMLFILLIFFSVNLSAQTPELYVLKGAELIDPVNMQVIPNSAVVVFKDKIQYAGAYSEDEIPPNAEIIDLSGKYLMPGMIDGHIHFFQSGGLYTRPDALDLTHRVPYEKELEMINDELEDTFKRYIQSGITSVVDNGGPFWNFDVKQLAASTKIAPRVFLTGPLISSYQPEALTTHDPPIIKVNSKEEALELEQEQINLGADFIKIWYIVDRGMTAEDFYDIVKAVVDKAHKHHLPVFVHATQLETAKKAIKAGADVLVHSVTDKPVDKEFLEMAKKNNVIYVPTAWVFNSYAATYTRQLDLLKEEHLMANPRVISTLFDMHEVQEHELGERQLKLLEENEPIAPNPVILNNLKAVNDAGIRIAAGTDAGNVGVLHGPSIFHDFALMKTAGLTEWDIIKSATINGAHLVNRQDEIGSIEAGKFADLVVLNSNPLEQIMNTADQYMVINNGNINYSADLNEKTPEELAQIQLNAYNEKDLEAFLSVYADDVEIYDFPDELVYIGKEKMREVYSEYFQKATDLYCKLVNRITVGNMVIDREYVTTGIPGRDPINAVAVYEIEDGLISKVWFMR